MSLCSGQRSHDLRILFVNDTASRWWKGYNYPMPPFGYTTQRKDSYIKLGLLDYRARQYDPRLGRFIQADTIIPDPSKPGDFDRYMYAAGNPVRYNDPSGHCGADTNQYGMEEQQALIEECMALRDNLIQLYGIDITGEWTALEMEWLLQALADAADFVGGAEQLTSVFQDALTNKGSSAGQLTFRRISEEEINQGWSSGAGWDPGSGTIFLGPSVFAPDNYRNRSIDTRPPSLGLFNREGSVQVSILHEIGHVFIDARPSVVGQYSQEREWGTRDPADNYVRPYSEGPYDGRPTFPGHSNPFEDLATSLAIFIATDGASYPKYQFQMDFVANNQDNWR